MKITFTVHCKNWYSSSIFLIFVIFLPTFDIFKALFCGKMNWDFVRPAENLNNEQLYILHILISTVTNILRVG